MVHPWPDRSVVMGLALLLCVLAPARTAPARPAAEDARPGADSAAASAAGAVAVPPSFRFRWLADLGAESLAAARPGAAVGGGPVMVSVPGAAYAFAVASDGSLERRKRLPADPSAPYGLAVTGNGMAVASKEGSVSLWDFTASGDLSLRWRRDTGERATSVGWDGGDTVLVATWQNKLMALSAADGRSLWTIDIGGRAEAPAVMEGTAVLVATKAKALLRIDAVTGALRWKVALPGLVLHPPVLFGEERDRVLCGTWEGQLLAFDALTGRVRWSAALPARLAGAPFACPDYVAAVTEDGAVHGYTPTGELRWTQPGSSDGPAALLPQSARGGAPRLLVVSQTLVALDPGTGARLGDYPKGAVEGLRQRFADAMLEGVKTYSEGEKRALLEREAFDISGPLFGTARLVGPHIAFGTEDEWAYLFDASTLRPLGRYRAGQACSSLPRLSAGRVLAIAGEEIFGLDASVGRTLWRRRLGAGARRITGDATLGIMAGGRVHALDPVDGVPRWSARGRFRSLAAPSVAEAEGSGATPWLVDDGEGSLWALRPPGRLEGEPLPAGGDLLAILPASGRSWVAATREGKLFSISWTEDGGSAEPAPHEGRLVKGWETSLDERLAEVRFADGRTFVRTETGLLLDLDESGREIWRLALASEDGFELVPQAASVVVLGATELRVHDWLSGEPRFHWPVRSPAVGADIRGGSLLWLDRAGTAHRVDPWQGRVVETKDLGVPLAAAVPTADGFIVTTAAGEVGLVEMTPGGPRAAGDAPVK